MITILVVATAFTDACAFYRSTGPLEALRRQANIRVSMVTCEPSWAEIAMSDVVLLVRPCSSIFARTAELAAAMEKPLWLDFDDNFFEIPPANPVYMEFSHPDAQQAIATCCSLANVVSVSTENLATKFILEGVPANNIVLLENAIPDWARPADPIERKKIIYWRGGSTHMEDLLSFAEAIEEAYDRTPRDWTWVFHGAYPWMLEIPFTHIPGDLLLNYFSKLYEVGPAVVIAPLAPNEFNRCKSNIAQQEAWLVGAHTVCPSWPQWEGETRYTSNDYFAAQVEKAINLPKATTVPPRVREVNKRRLAILARLLNKPELINA